MALLLFSLAIAGFLSPNAMLRTAQNAKGAI